MFFESCYWKEGLLKHAKQLRPVKKPKRWSQRLVMNFEKELIISFFMIRKLFETRKISDNLKKYKGSVFFYKASGKKITRFNEDFIEELYDLENEKVGGRGIIFISNQLIHSCTLLAYRNKDRNWGGVYACSDFEKNKMIYRIPITEIKKILELVGNNYPAYSKYYRDYETGEYKYEVY